MRYNWQKRECTFKKRGKKTHYFPSLNFLLTPSSPLLYHQHPSPVCFRAASTHQEERGMWDEKHAGEGKSARNTGRGSAEKRGERWEERVRDGRVRERDSEEEETGEREESAGVGCPRMGLLLFCSGPISFVLFVCWHQRAASHSPC